jgi:hypothetical protein
MLRLRWLAAVGALPLAVLAVFACSDWSRDLTQPITSLGRSHVLNSAQQERLHVAKQYSQWAGQAHHEAMQVIIRDIAKRKRSRRVMPRKGSAEYCALLEEAGDSAIAIIDRHRKLHRDHIDRVMRVRQDPALAQCERSLAVFGVALRSVATSHQTSESEPEVTGSYEYYLDPMEEGVRNSTGTVASVQAAVDGVLANAVSAGIPDGDLLALTSFAGLIVSSAAEWNAFDWAQFGGSGNDSTCSVAGGCAAMSVFSRRGVGEKILKVIGVDAIGCLSTVKGWGALKALLVGPAWPALAGECGIRAALASAGAIIGML